MPNYLTAKALAEEALKEIGSFSPSMEQADIGELRVALSRLEMILNSKIGHNQTAGYWRTIDIDIAASDNDYKISSYANTDGVQYVFSANRIDSNGSVFPLEMLTQREWDEKNKTETGSVEAIFITRDNDGYVHTYPKPPAGITTGDTKIQLRVQTFAPKIDHKGIADNDMFIRPTWYWWAVTKLAYAIGRGAVRRLPDGELRRLKDDYMQEEKDLMAGDNHDMTGIPYTTEPEDY
jgi:hypothetical protein